MKKRERALPRAAVSVLCFLYAAVWCCAGVLGETTVFGRTALWARCADVLFGLILLSGAVVWGLRAARAGRRRGERDEADEET